MGRIFLRLYLPRGEGKALPTQLPLPETTIAPQGLTYSKSMRCGPALLVHSKIRSPVRCTAAIVARR
jgi:hypothetical protein